MTSKRLTIGASGRRGGRGCERAKRGRSCHRRRQGGAPTDGVAADGAPKKKRTRRGTRGGRSRSRSGCEACRRRGRRWARAGAEGDAAGRRLRRGSTSRRPSWGCPKTLRPILLSMQRRGAPDVSADGASDVAAAEGEAPKKKTRRGTRGGRKRRKPPPTQQRGERTGDRAIADATAATTVFRRKPGEYVPMSEWIDDFDSRSRS